MEGKKSNTPGFLLLALVALLSVSHISQFLSNDSEQEVTTTLDEADLSAAAATLDSYHAAAATADWQRYFDLMSENSIFLGTDSSERWSKAVFQKYAAKTNGWTYVPTSRNLTPAGTPNAIFFDEILENQSYGRSRGTGLLIREGGRWLIAQYHLTFPIPNDLAAETTAEIKRWRAAQSKE